ncbi:Gmad2 immunoglobulin-like domain-containing protein [Nocardioides zeae]|uniref:Gmad2 immunoglobulin-like domain-containing protein n=1 Tax=Nocardioides imazamoxiresistens TaxID=3231893 RepID=A0ABU3Q131_9ACTN|nr:Gmad2 immunoglobulin-like domain-containing protein [Nocardioides zeae]MDT9595222.1 Gmad2 immunoglobulin-like domain-containing protein [Nocardioides zeae]
MSRPTTRRTTPRRILAPLAAGAVLAATLVACGEEDVAPGDPGTPSESATETADDGAGTPAPSSEPTATETGEPTAVAAYFVVDGPRGPVLTREFQQASDGGLPGALELLAGEPLDPDYTNLVAGWVGGAEQADGEIRVTVSGPAPGAALDVDPALAVQQVVLTLQAAVGDTLPVRFVDSSGAEVGELGGATNPVSAAPALETLLPVSIDDPAEGSTVSGTFTARGRANTFENTVVWRVLDGEEVVLEGFTTHEGSWTEERLHAWETEIDASGLEPGSYTLVVTSDDVSGGEGPGPAQDTKDVTIG